MLVAHHVVDILRGKTDRLPLMDIPHLLGDRADRMATLIEQAQKFDFGTLVFERIGEGEFALPGLTRDEREFWVEGLIPLPFPVVWYEFTLGKSRSGILAMTRDEGWSWEMQRLDYTTRALLWEDISLSIDRRAADPDGNLKAKIGGNVRFYQAMKDAAASEPLSGIEKVIHNNVHMVAPLALYLTLMLNSRTTERRASEPAPAKLNRKRAKIGRAPLADHTIVTIIPDRFREESEREARGTHQSPRLHWRRSHLRHYDHHTLASKWMPSAKHADREGWWIAVIPRMLVGRADLGEVSHEYRIEQGEKP